MDPVPPPLPPLPLAGQAPERRDAAANRERILRAARGILDEHGVQGLSMDAVATAAGVGKGTIFRRFGDRAGLTEALLDDYMRDLQDAFLTGPPPLGPGAPPAERLRAFVAALVRLQYDNLAIAMAAETRDRRRAPDAYGTLLIHLRVLVSAVDPALNAHAVATMILGSISPGVLQQLNDQGPDAVVAAVTALLQGAVSTAP